MQREIWISQDEGIFEGQVKDIIARCSVMADMLAEGSKSCKNWECQSGTGKSFSTSIVSN